MSTRPMAFDSSPVWVRMFLILFTACFGISDLHAAYDWRNVAIGGGGYVSGLVYHPTERNLLYARTDVGGAYRWNESSGRWIALNDDLGGLDNEFMQLGVLSIALDPTNPRVVYLACGQYVKLWAPAARLLRSSNQGTTWTHVTLPFKLGGNQSGRGTGERLSVDPFQPNRLLLGTSADGLWQSLDRGSHWKRITTFSPEVTTFVLHDPKARGVIYAGTDELAGKSLWRSTDSGDTWSPVPGQPTDLMALQGKLDTAGTLYLAFGNGIGPNGISAGAVWKLARSAGAITGANWSNIDPPSGQGGYCGLSLDPQRPGVVIVATLDRWGPRDEIYLSLNGGASWKGILTKSKLDLSQHPWATGMTPHWISDVEINPFDSNQASFVTGFGVFTTHNLNAAKPVWIFSNAGLEETVPNGLYSPAAGPFLVSAIGDFDGFRHDDIDNSSTAKRLNPHHGTNDGITGAALAPAMLVRWHRSGSISRDGGATWKDFPDSPPTATHGSGRMALSADGTRILWCPAKSAPYWSVDDGATWIASSGVAEPVESSLIPEADSMKPSVFYLYDPARRAVLRSLDGGVSFKASFPGLSAETNRLVAVPGRVGELWASADRDGLVRLLDGAANVVRIKGVDACYTLGFGKARTAWSPPAAYIWGTVRGVTGVYRSDDDGASWVRINDDQHQFGRISRITGDARVYGRVYLGSSGRGIIVGEPR